MSEPYKIVEKNWGKEIWYSLTDSYCLKQIFIKKGHRTSLQYHANKEETNVIISGRALVTVGHVVCEAGPGDFFHLKPLVTHRFEAVEDLTMIEASTIHVDDVVRLSDDYGREGTSEP